MLLETVASIDHSLRTWTPNVSNFLKFTDSGCGKYFIPGQDLQVDSCLVGLKGKILPVGTQKKHN
jgi:hypothetical protein